MAGKGDAIISIRSAEELEMAREKLREAQALMRDAAESRRLRQLERRAFARQDTKETA